MEDVKEVKKPKKRHKVAGIIGYILIFAIILVLAFVVISKVTNHTVFIFDRTTAWVMTPSMEPEIPAQSYILLKRVDPSTIKVGDVITFLSDDPDLKSLNAYNTHRVVEIIGDNEEFVTKGDANSIDDGAYSAKAENIVGRYVKTLHVMTFIAITL